MIDKLKSAKKDTTWKAKAQARKHNRDWLDLSFAIAVKVLGHLRKEGITQKQLAEKMQCSPQYLNKILKGKENLTLETICKLQRVTGLQLIEVVEKPFMAKAEPKEQVLEIA